MMRTLGLLGALSILALTAPIGCGDPFSSGTGSGGGTTSSTTTTSSGGGQGGGGTGGAGGTSTTGGGGTGGQGGASPCEEGQCGDTEFCAPDATCQPCSDFAYPLEFGPAEAIDVSPGSGPWFPRVRDEAGSLRMFFAAAPSGENFDLAQSELAGGTWSAGIYLSNTFNSGAAETGPLPLPSGVVLPGLGLPNTNLIVFTAFDAQVNRRIFAADVTGGQKVLLPNVGDPIETYSIAIAHALTPPRYWYMNRHIVGNPGVSTNDFMTKLPAEVQPHPITGMMLPNGQTLCPLNLNDTPDLAPWVTAGGELLMFHAAVNLDGNCAGEKVLRMFYVALDGDGMPTGDIREPSVESLSETAAVQTPSLSPDSCSLFFSSNHDGERQLYWARRR